MKGYAETATIAIDVHEEGILVIIETPPIDDGYFDLYCSRYLTSTKTSTWVHTQLVVQFEAQFWISLDGRLVRGRMDETSQQHRERGTLLYHMGYT